MQVIFFFLHLDTIGDIPDYFDITGNLVIRTSEGSHNRFSLKAGAVGTQILDDKGFQHPGIRKRNPVKLLFIQTGRDNELTNRPAQKIRFFTTEMNLDRLVTHDDIMTAVRNDHRIGYGMENGLQ